MIRQGEKCGLKESPGEAEISSLKATESAPQVSVN